MWANSISGLKSPKALNIYLKKILPFNEKNWRWILKEIFCPDMRVSCAGIWSVHAGNTQWNFRAQDTAAQPCGSVLLYEWVSVQHCHGNPGSDWHSGWAPSAQLWSCSLLPRAALPGTGSIPGRCQSPAGTLCTRQCLTTNTSSWWERMF